MIDDDASCCISNHLISVLEDLLGRIILLGNLHHFLVHLVGLFNELLDSVLHRNLLDVRLHVQNVAISQRLDLELVNQYLAWSETILNFLGLFLTVIYLERMHVIEASMQLMLKFSISCRIVECFSSVVIFFE